MAAGFSVPDGAWVVTRFDRASEAPFFQRPLIFWLIIGPLVIATVLLIGSMILKERAGRAALAEQALSYEAQATAIDQARERSRDRESARRSTVMQ